MSSVCGTGLLTVKAKYIYIPIHRIKPILLLLRTKVDSPELDKVAEERHLPKDIQGERVRRVELHHVHLMLWPDLLVVVSVERTYERRPLHLCTSHF